MATFPSFEKNADRPRQAIGITAPSYDDNADHSKTADAAFLEQQWRDVETSGVAAQHPLSINRDADEVTTDPYSA
jgi:hypothetical protein